MSQEVMIPDWAKVKPAGAFQALNAHDDSLSDGIGQGYPVVGYKGKVWSWRYRGERKAFIRPDDGTPSAYLDVIILAQAKTKSKSYYKKYDPTQQGDGERPICSSIDGVTPDPDVMQKQADACALCPRNVWTTGENGRKGRECTDYKRLAVLVLPTLTAPLNNGQGVLEPAFLRVPPASLNSLAIMGDTMAAQGHHYSSYITRITFDPQEAHPKMVFRPLQPLSEAEAPQVLQMRQELQVDRIIHGGFAPSNPSQGGMAMLPPGAQPTGLLAGPSTATTPPTPPTAGVSSGLGSAPPAGTNGGSPMMGFQATSTGLSSTPATPAPTGSGIVTNAAPPPDGGAAEDSDADLDALITKVVGQKP